MATDGDQHAASVVSRSGWEKIPSKSGTKRCMRSFMLAVVELKKGDEGKGSSRHVRIKGP
jgi:hypothetical protein